MTYQNKQVLNDVFTMGSSERTKCAKERAGCESLTQRHEDTKKGKEGAEYLGLVGGLTTNHSKKINSLVLDKIRKTP